MSVCNWKIVFSIDPRYKKGITVNFVLASSSVLYIKGKGDMGGKGSTEGIK